MPSSIDRREVQRLRRDEDAQVVDVLPTEEFHQEHIAQAISIPLEELDERAPRELDPRRPVILYCNDFL